MDLPAFLDHLNRGLPVEGGSPVHQFMHQLSQEALAITGKNELSNLYTLSGMVAERRADLVVNSILKYVTDIDDVKGLGFCVSIAHAQFMARYFNTHGIPSMALTGDSPDEERNAAKQRLVSGKLRFLFVVDIYNEGVDIPEVNTVLFLRPIFQKILRG